MKGTWQTTEGGGGSGELVLILLGVLFLGGPVLAAVVALIQALVVIAVVCLVAAIAALVGLLAFLGWRARHPAVPPWQPGILAAERREQMATLPTRPAIEAPRQELHIHHHWHGVQAEDVADIIRQQQEDQQP